MLKTLKAALLVAVLAVPATVTAQGYTPKGPIEAQFQVAGPWAVTKIVSAAACDSEGRLCDIWYPTNLGTNPIKGLASGFKHPVISWANGTGQLPAKYAYLLNHLASWGFIVVASRDDGTGNGKTTVDAANFIKTQGNTASSVFYNKVDGTNVGGAGHSQGGDSVVRLLAANNTTFKTYAAYHAGPWFFAILCCNLTTGTLSSSGANKSIIYFNGTADADDRTWYNATPATAQKVYGLLTGNKHDDEMGNPNCQAGTNCANGVQGYLGYTTAWFMWKLQGDTNGPAAFKSSGGEFVTPSAGWTANLSNIP